MHDDVVLALPKMPFSFSNTRGGLSRTQVLVRAVTLDRARELVLLVRVHAVNLGAAVSLGLIALPAAPTREDPLVDFVANTSVASISLAGSAAGDLLRSVLATPLPTHLQLQLRVTQAVPAQSIEATLSIELLAKT